MIRKRTREERIDKFGTDNYKYYASREAVKGLEIGQEFIKKHPTLKYWRIVFFGIFILLIIYFIKLIIWIKGLIW